MEKILVLILVYQNRNSEKIVQFTLRENVAHNQKKETTA